jgi:acyl-CoA synthetase (AMP-forming)/AMP-acid ligase II
MIVGDGFLAAAAAAPDTIVVECDGAAFRAHRFAAMVAAARDVLGGDRRVAIVMRNSASALAAFLGAVQGGATAMVLDPAWPESLRDRLLARHAPEIAVDGALPQAPATPIRPRPGAPLLMGFTSGTTGTPKAFVRSHASWIATFAAARAVFGGLAQSRVLAPGPLAHSLTLYAAVETLEAGGAILLQTRFDAAICAVRLAADADAMIGVPAMFDLLVRATPTPVRRPVTLVSAGAKLLPALRTRLEAAYPAARLYEYYGASELSFVSASVPDDGAPPESVGRAFPGVDLAVRRDDGAVAAVGEIGTLWVRSAMVSDGYVGDTDGTGFRTDGGESPWATVGDRGHVDADGFLFLAGRENDMLISGGYNVYPAEIEAVLAAVPGVRAVAVVGVADARWGHRIVAVVAGDVRRTALETACAAALPPYKAPRDWRHAPMLPRTASGKIARAEVEAMLPSLEALP